MFSKHLEVHNSSKEQLELPLPEEKKINSEFKSSFL